MSANTMRSEFKSLKQDLNEALPQGFACRTRYILTPSRQCDPLFSPLPGHKSDRTWLASHLLMVSVVAAQYDRLNSDRDKPSDDSDVLVFAVEVLVYSTKHLTTMFVSKADSTGYLPHSRPSPVKIIATTFLSWLVQQQRHKRPSRRIVISLFGRAQNQYLFPASSEHGGKHVLDDRQLIKWWARVLDPIFSFRSADVNCKGYITVPSYHTDETMRLFAPPGSFGGSSPRWQPGNPLSELGQARGLPAHAPPRCLLPRFPDDPKARFISDLDDEVGLLEERKVNASPSKRKNGRWASIRDLDRFWEAMEFRQECSSGRVVGFLWLVISPLNLEKGRHQDMVGSDGISLDDSQSDKPSTTSDLTQTTAHDDQQFKSSIVRRKRLSGPIIPRQPRSKGSTSSHNTVFKRGGGAIVSKEGYDKAMQTLLNLDFANLKVATQSTSTWIANVSSIYGASANVWVSEIFGENKDILPILEQSSLSANDLGGVVRKKRKADEGNAGLTHTETSVSKPTINILTSTMVRKKPKA